MPLTEQEELEIARALSLDEVHMGSATMRTTSEAEYGERELTIPAEFAGGINGKKGKNVRLFQSVYGVNVTTRG